MQLFGVNVANIFAVGLASSLIGAGIAYFVLIRSVDFRWWWLFILFGAQFLSVVVVAYVLQKSLKFNNMFCEAPVLVVDNCALNSLFVAPKFIASDCSLSTSQGIDANSADWQDLVQQLEQMSKLPVTAGVAVSDVTACVSAVIKTAVQSAPAAPLLETPMFNFAVIASGLATPAPETVTVPVVASTPILTPAKTGVTMPGSASVATFAPTPAPTAIPAKVIVPSPAPVVAAVPASVAAAPTPTSAFDFSAMASALATPAPASIPAKTITANATVPMTTVAPASIPAKVVTTTPLPIPVPPAQTAPSIDFAALFR